MGALDDLIARSASKVWRPDADAIRKIARLRELDVEWAAITEAVSADVGFPVGETTIRRHYKRFQQQDC